MKRNKVEEKDGDKSATARATFVYITTPKKKKPKKCANLYNYFSEFCDYTTIHGFKYLGEQKRAVVEKIWWIIVFCISLSVCIRLIMETYQKWETSPVIVSFAQSPTAVWSVPFPSVTICSETKSRQSVFNFTAMYHKANNISAEMSAAELEKFSDISLVCDDHLLLTGNKTTTQKSIDYLTEVLKKPELDSFLLLPLSYIMVSPPFDEMLWVCKWTSTNESCTHLFTPMLTEEGVCYNFNMLDREDLFTDAVMHKRDYLNHGKDAGGWSLEGGYPQDTPMDTFPRRALGSGLKAGLTILLRAYDYDLDFLCRGPVQGFKVLLHHPAETPRVSQQYFRAPLNQEVVVAVKPDMMTTSDGLRGYSPERRECFFQNERQLYFYKNYTQQNCEVECLTNFTLAACGCVSYHMPHSEDTPICGSGSTECVGLAQKQVLAQEISNDIADKMYSENVHDFTENDKFTKIRHHKCDCKPACTSLKYNAETSQADFNWVKLFQAYEANMNEFPGIQMTRIKIFFKENQFITSQRTEMYGLVDFLASCGGLLGLFTGFSFISGFEIFYFLTLRMWCNIKRHGRSLYVNTNNH